MIEIRQLGAIPIVVQIAASIVMKLAAGGITSMMAVRETAKEFLELKDMEEAEFHELAVLLARETEHDEHEWFTTLMNMQKWGMLEWLYPQPEPEPEPEPKPKNSDNSLTDVTPSWMYWMIGVFGIAAIILATKK